MQRIAFAMALIATGIALPSTGAYGQAAHESGIRFEVRVLPQFDRYAILFAYPSYAAIAMESAGVPPSAASRVIAVSGQVLEFRDVLLRFTGSAGELFSYEMSARVLGQTAGQGMLALPATVNTMDLPKGRLIVIIKPPLVGLIPNGVADKIRFKAQYLADEEAQRKILAYLDTLAKTVSQEKGPAALLEAIVLDGHNKHGGPAVIGAREHGDAESFSEQIYLVITLAIWFIVVPMLLLARRLWRSRPLGLKQGPKDE